MNIKNIVSFLLISNLSIASLVIDPPQKVPGFKLSIDNFLYLTDTNGVALPEQVINAQIGKSIKIYRTDGFCYDGMITEIQESDDLYKIYGLINNVDDASFGFVIAKGGVFAGAVVEKKNAKTYVLEFSPRHKGYVFNLTNRYNKTI
jgi:hypothetical protein